MINDSNLEEGFFPRPTRSRKARLKPGCRRVCTQAVFRATVVAILGVIMVFSGYATLNSLSLKKKAMVVEDRSMAIMDGAHAVFSWMYPVVCNGTTPILPGWTKTQCQELVDAVFEGGIP